MIRKYLVGILSIALFYNQKTITIPTVLPSQDIVVKAKSWISDTISSIKLLVSSNVKSLNTWLMSHLTETESNESVFWKILFAFIAGLIVSLTPCIYPLIPITIGILSSGRKLKKRSQLLRSLFYLFGISTTFATLGLSIIKFNIISGSWLANPWIISIVVSFFVFLALTMLEFIDFDIVFFEIKTPEVSSIFSAFFYGAVTGLVASPCMTPALLTLLGLVAQENNYFIGSAILFSFALGMSFLVIILSSFSGLLFLMPKPGRWMLEFRHALGFVILFLSINFLEPILFVWQILFLRGTLWLMMAFYYYFNSRKEAISRMIIAHRTRAETERSDEIGFFEHMSPIMILKKVFSIFAFFLALYCFGKSYLVFHKVRLFTVLKKLLLK